MSNKTIFKRIALVAVTALGAGVLSVPANAAAPNNNAVGSSNIATTAGVLNIATAPSIIGDAELAANGAASGTTSLGLLTNSTVQNGASLTSTATMRSDGEIAFYWTGSAIDKALTIEVSGGTVTGMTAAGDEAINYNAAKTQVVAADDGAAVISNFSVTPNSGSTSMTVSAYESGTITAADDAAMIVQVAAIQAGTVSRGTLVQRYLVTVATTSASGVYSAADSYVKGDDATPSAPTSNTDETIASASATYPTANPLVVGNSAGVGYVSFALADAYGVSLTGLGALVASATNGAQVALYDTSGGYGAAATVTLLTAVSNYATGTLAVARPAASAGKGFSTTVTLSWNGVVVGTRSFTFLGEVASMVVTPRRVASLGGTSTDAFRVTYTDSNGTNLIGLAAPATASAVSSTLTTVVTAAAVATAPTSTTAALGSITCASGASAYLGGGTANIQLQHVNASSGTTVKSNVFAASCQGNAYSYTAGFDRAIYTPGSIATLTITLKDRDGDLANGYDTWAASNVATITGGPSATAVAIPVVGDTATSGTGLQGIKTYQFVVGSTEGDFQAVVSLADVNSRNTSQANQTVAYSVKASTTAVSNADVLKSIVALIASINKQIQALQKLILARR